MFDAWGNTCKSLIIRRIELSNSNKSTVERGVLVAPTNDVFSRTGENPARLTSLSA